MFGARRVSVSVGDEFIETLTGKRKIFKSMGIVDSAPADTFQSLWVVSEMIVFNDLPHARLTNHQTGQVRTISLDALERQEIYKKKK